MIIEWIYLKRKLPEILKRLGLFEQVGTFPFLAGIRCRTKESIACILGGEVVEEISIYVEQVSSLLLITHFYLLA